MGLDLEDVQPTAICGRQPSDDVDSASSISTKLLLLISLDGVAERRPKHIRPCIEKALQVFLEADSDKDVSVKN